MKHLALATCILALASTELAICADCDCEKVPFRPDPPCFNTCVGKILASPSKQQLREITEMLKIDDSVSRKISSYAERTSAKSLDDFKKVLTEKELQHVVDAFERLTPERFEKIHRGLRDDLRRRNGPGALP